MYHNLFLIHLLQFLITIFLILIHQIFQNYIHLHLNDNLPFLYHIMQLFIVLLPIIYVINLINFHNQIFIMKPSIYFIIIMLIMLMIKFNSLSFQFFTFLNLFHQASDLINQFLLIIFFLLMIHVLLLNLNNVFSILLLHALMPPNYLLILKLYYFLLH